MNSDDDICKALSISNFDNINSAFINNIISQEYKQYDKMKALECLIGKLITKNRFPIDKETVIGKGAYGVASLITAFNGSKLVVKENTLQKTSDKEYLVGRHLNVLRQYTPCFSYVFGQTTDKKVIYEYAGSTSLDEWKNANINNTNDFLMILVQILLSVEIAQRKYRYIHNDLHGSNIMLRDIRATYTLIVGDIEYEFNNVLVPCIIDYGLSYIKVDDKYIPEANYVRPRFCIQGFDPYFLLARSVRDTPLGHIKTTAVNILNSFYKGVNPYTLTMLDNQFSKVYESACATRTSLDLAMFIIQPLNSPNLLIKPRSVYIQQTPWKQFPDDYTQLLGGEANYSLEIQKCSESCNSFIVSKYFNFKNERKYETLENDRRVISELLEYLASLSADELIGICNVILSTPIQQLPKTGKGGIDKLFKALTFIDLFNTLYYMGNDQELKRLLKMKHSDLVSKHFLNANYYYKSTSWYTTLEEYMTEYPS